MLQSATMIKKEVENELDPVNADNPEAFAKGICKLYADPNKVLPIICKDSSTGEYLGDYFIKYIKSDKCKYFQVEGISTPRLKRILLERMRYWTVIQPGIYRTEIKSA